MWRMGKDKLRKFAENETFGHVFQPKANSEADEYRGCWHTKFEQPQPLTLELGCGKGEYTVALSKKYPQKNFLGIDIKGARLWRGAKTVDNENIPNAAFLRIRIEFIEEFFAENEVDEIWITFPDPQIKKPRKRLTSPIFLERYGKFLKKNGVIHLKTDSRMLHDYTLDVVRNGGHTLIDAFTDVYTQCPDNELLQIKTFYEAMFAARNIPITYLKFML
ncbi:MAG: tRNA (guanosine(46)-N7)-methyltransferase TrmB [Prevotellaceae bacterium]|jgi:tRNA (guanine-N7-)-methyltransferase|nr:tRNA (guanosine(46)-N7)-methyltransferase TrmB [Prevotellaceae bacterium]